MAEKEKGLVGVPTVGGIGDAFKDFGVGAVAGILFLLASRMFGGLGILAAPLLVGSMVKGDRGKMIALIAGFMLIAAGGLAQKKAANGNGNEEVM